MPLSRTRMNRTCALRLALLMGVGCSAVCVAPAAAQQKPNIIIFLADDLGYGDLGCYGHPIIQTPNIDAFAEAGVRLTDCHSAGTVCSHSLVIFTSDNGPETPVTWQCRM